VHAQPGDEPRYGGDPRWRIVRQEALALAFHAGPHEHLNAYEGTGEEHYGENDCGDHECFPFVLNDFRLSSWSVAVEVTCENPQVPHGEIRAFGAYSWNCGNGLCGPSSD
jgi:hypothetical protein